MSLRGEVKILLADRLLSVCDRFCVQWECCQVAARALRAADEGVICRICQPIQA